MKKRYLASLMLACAVMTLAACGGGGDGTPGPGNPGGGGTSPPSDGSGHTFSEHAEWTFALPAKGDALCYDIDSRQEVACDDDDQWDLKVLGDGSSASFWTNSGVSGPGQGGAFGGPFDHSWAELQQWQSALVDPGPDGGEIPPQAFSTDQSSGVFTGTNDIQSAAFEYDLDGSHQLFPTYRVFLVTTDSNSADAVGTASASVYALQVIGYYGGPSGTESGHPTLRWINRVTPDFVRTREYDPSSGTVYINLASGDEVGADGDWQVALDRYNVSLNGGDSGPGTVAGFVGKTPDDLYNTDSTPSKSTFLAATPDNTLQYLTTANMTVPTAASDWITDTDHSVLNPDFQGTFPNPLQFGWYNYYPTAAAAAAANPPLPAAHMTQATPDGASLLRSGEGDSYARFHLSDISYTDPADATSTQTWTIEFDIQPAP